jgi:integrase
MGRLSDKAVKAAGVGRHGDGEALFLIVASSGSRKWVLRFQLMGKRRDMGLGAYPQVTLAAARQMASEARSLIARGVDPIAARESNRRQARPIPKFKEIAAEVISEAQARTANAKVAYQWERHLGPVYSGPLLDRPVNEITTLDVAAVLRPVWRMKPEVARKLYPAIRRVFEAARIRLRDEHGIAFQNPAIWADLKAMGFEQPKALTRGRHPSLPYQRMPDFIAALRGQGGAAALMLEFAILTNVRGGSARAAAWDQFDLDAGIWRVPVAHLKDKHHRTEAFRVPMAPRVLDILAQMQKVRTGPLVFPSPRGKMFSDMSMGAAIRRMNAPTASWIDPADGRPVVQHGFHASFRIWAEEQTHFSRSVIEEAMGHVVGNAVERAYRRTDVLEQRRSLMAAWANHCEPKAGNVVAFGRKA